MSKPQINVTRNCVRETREGAQADWLLKSLGHPKISKTDILECRFSNDPWDIVSTSNVLLTQLTEIHLTVARTYNENAPTSAFAFLAFKQQYWYKAFPTLDLYLLDRNHDEITRITINETYLGCGNPITRTYASNFNLQYYDLVESSMLVMGAATWERC